VLAVLAVGAAAVAAFGGASRATAAATPTFDTNFVVAAPDFATDSFSDPWDYSNADDLLTDQGPAQNLISPRIADGLLSFSARSGAYISPLWAGYPGSLRLGRDGALPNRQLRAAMYTRIHLRAYFSAQASAALAYFTCDAPSGSCIGGIPFWLGQGWHDYDFLLSNRMAGGKPYAGTIKGVRFAIGAQSLTSAQVDFIRIYHPTAQSLVTWSSPRPGRPATLFWSDGAAYGTTSTRHFAPVVSASASTVGASGRTTTDVGGYPAGSVFYAVASDGTITPVNQMLHLVSRPVPIIDSPTQAGCGDYAVTALGHPWTFRNARDLEGWANAGALTFSNGVLSATNAGPNRNDPHLNLPMGRGGINGSLWHRLTITEGYDGPFNLANAPGGGTMGRLMWIQPGRTMAAQTDDILTYSGNRSIFIDMATPASVLTEPDGPAAQRYAFSAGPVVHLRWDPNEDPGARHWRVYRVQLSQDCSTRTAFTATWHDAQYTPGAVSTVIARSSTDHDYVLGTVAERAAGNSFAVQARSLPRGRYSIRINTRIPGVVGVGASSGPLVIS
jgi:hypothetical protein